ncbi:MAG: hypothetical protein FJX42_00295 [Alphaproteobacteria bacterium]|nr:hypothetical protein [Alphaproteobacteria bacterium]
MRPMTDSVRISSTPTPLLEVPARAQRTMREVRAHAAVYADAGDNPDMQKAVGKLRRTLNSGQPLRPDVPRGYYLNFTV